MLPPLDRVHKRFIRFIRAVGRQHSVQVSEKKGQKCYFFMIFFVLQFFLPSVCDLHDLSLRHFRNQLVTSSAESRGGEGEEGEEGGGGGGGNGTIKVVGGKMEEGRRRAFQQDLIVCEVGGRRGRGLIVLVCEVAAEEKRRRRKRRRCQMLLFPPLASLAGGKGREKW